MAKFKVVFEANEPIVYAIGSDWAEGAARRGALATKRGGWILTDPGDKEVARFHYTDTPSEEVVLIATATPAAGRG